jgi:hypothetical protein
MHVVSTKPRVSRDNAGADFLRPSQDLLCPDRLGSIRLWLPAIRPKYLPRTTDLHVIYACQEVIPCWSHWFEEALS